MKLIMSPASPFVRTVRVLVREANLTDTVSEVQVSTSPLATDPQARAANPLGKIPALVRHDAPAIVDSRVICRFLNDHAGTDFYPASRLWEILTLEALVNGIMDASVSMAYEGRLRPPEKQSAEWVEAQWSKVDHALTGIENGWMSHLSGPLNIGQIGLACALSYIDLRHDARNWRAAHGTLVDWHARFCERDSMGATAPE